MRSRLLPMPFTVPALGVPTLAVAVALFLAPAAGAVAVRPPVGQSAARATALASTGYILGGSRNSLVVRDAHALATLGVDGVSISTDGTTVDAPDPGLTRLAATAHTNGLRAELLVSNFENGIGDFDPDAAAKLLQNPDNVTAVAARLAGFVAAQGWDGIQLDLESLDAADAAGLTQLAQDLQADMSPEKSVSIAVMASTRLSEYADRGYQLAALGQVIDTMTLMTYDQHGPGWSGPGPIGARSWQRRALGTLLTQVPAAKVDLGVAGYGYTWPKHKAGRTVSDKQARALVKRDGARAVWHAGPGEWSAHLSDGTVMWWSDKRSYKLRVTLAEQAGLHGLSIWRLGSMDPLPG